MTDLWSTETRIGPLHFQTGCHRRRLNLALVVLCLFCGVVHFWLVNACFCCVTFSFSIPSQEIGLGNVSEMTNFVSSGTWNHNSVNQWLFSTWTWVPVIFLPPVVWEENYWDKWHRFPQDTCPSCHRTNSVWVRKRIDRCSVHIGCLMPWWTCLL